MITKLKEDSHCEYRDEDISPEYQYYFRLGFRAAISRLSECQELAKDDWEECFRFWNNKGSLNGSRWDPR